MIKSNLRIQLKRGVDKIKVSDFVKNNRFRLNMTQAELGNKLGKDPRNISSYENDHSEPPGSVIIGILKLIDPDHKTLQKV